MGCSFELFPVRGLLTFLLFSAGLLIAATGIVLHRLADPAVQSQLAHAVTRHLTARTETAISIDSASLSVFRSLQLSGVLVRDQQGDTLLYSRQLNAGINLIRAAFGRIHLRSLHLDQALIRLQRRDDTADWNFQFLLDAFSGNDTVKGKSPRLQIGELRLENIRFELHDRPNHTRLHFLLPRLQVAVEQTDLSRSLFVIRHIILDQPDLQVYRLAGSQTDEPRADTGIVHLNTKPLRLRVHRFALMNGQFRYDDEQEPVRTGTFDGLHQSYRHLNLILTNGALLHDRIEAIIDQLSFEERCGFRVTRLSGEAAITPGAATLANLQLTTPHSTLADSFAFYYKNFHAFYDFTNEVGMHVRLKNASVGPADLAYFGLPLPLAAERIRISGTATGPLADFDVTDLQLQAGRLTRFQGHASFNGLPDVQQTFISVEADNFISNADDLRRITGSQSLAQRLAAAGTIGFQGSFLGFPSDFVAYGTFRTQLGTLRSDLNMKLSDATATYSGNLATEQFDIGQLLNRSGSFGRLTLDVSVTGSGLDVATASARLTGKVDRLEYEGYPYSGIVVDGWLNQQQFDGMLRINDPNLQLDFSGLINLSATLPTYRFTARLQHADLARLGLGTTPLRLQANVNLNLAGRTVDDLSGQVQVAGLHLHREHQHFLLDSLYAFVSEGGQESRRKLAIRSSVLQADVTGRFALSRLPADVLRSLQYYFPLLPAPEAPVFNQDFDFNITSLNISPLIRILLPELDGLNNTRLQGHFQAASHKLVLQGNIPQLRYGPMDFGTLTLEGTAPADSQFIRISGEEWRIGDTMRIARPAITAQLGPGKSRILLSAQSFDRQSHLHLPVAITADNQQMQFHLLPGEIRLNGIVWSLSPNNRIRFQEQRLLFENFVLTSGFRMLEVQNINPRVRATNLALRFHQIPLEDFPQLTRIGNWRLSGQINGSAELINVFNNLRINARLTAFRFGINEALIDQALFAIDYVPEKDELQINTRLSDANYDVVVSGSYFPKRKSQQLDLTLQVNEAELALAEALFFRELVSETSGRASGRLRLYGTLKAPLLTGKMDIAGLQTTVDYLKTRYSSPALTLRFRESAIDLGRIRLYDRNGDSALVSGQIPHRNLDDWRLAVTLQTNRFLLLNTTATDDSLFYGTGIASGIITFSGSADAPEIVANLRTERGSRISIPIYNTSSVAQSSFIEFRQAGQSAATASRSGPDMASLSMAFNVEVTPEALFRIIFDEKTGDIIEASGAGDLRMEVVLPDEFNMYGRLQVAEGQYLFTQYNFFNKYFTIDPGGTIEWNGSPYDARLNLSAVYSTRASLEVLLAESALLSEQDRRELRQRQAVDLYLMLNGPLAAPEISFDIRLAENTGTSNAANLVLMRIRQDENELNKQVFGVLLLGHFLPPSADLVGSGLGTEVNNNLSEFLFNQLSYLASSIRSDVDLNVSYQTYEASINPADPADLVRRNELQVALTKRFFNDRLALDVGGNFDFGGSGVQQPPTGIAGDFAVDYKITPDGRIRARVFSKSDYDAIDERVKTRNGIGIKISRDFNNLRELFGRSQATLTSAVTDSTERRRPTAARRPGQQARQRY